MKPSPRKDRLLLALLSEPTLEAAAIRAGISQSTAWRIMRSPEFQAEYREARAAAVGRATGALQAASGIAVLALVDVAASDNPRTKSARVAAARTILELSYKAVELESIEARLAALERSK